MDIEEVMLFLVEHRAPGLPAEGFAEVFESLAWCMNNETNVMTVTRRWLREDDEYRAALALWIDDVFPADSRAELVALADDIRVRFPALASRADEWVRRWDAQHPPAGRPSRERTPGDA